MPNFGRHATRKGSSGISNIVLQKKEDAIDEFQSGVIGPKVWSYLFLESGFSVPTGWTSLIPSTESLKNIEHAKEEMVILGINKINRFKIDGFFWGNLGVAFKHDLSENFSSGQYLQKGLGIEEGVYVGNPNGISLGDNLKTQKTSLGPNSFIPFMGLQMIPEAVHYILFDKFLNPNHMVRCHCALNLKKSVLVGGGDKAIRIIESGVSSKRIALGCMRRVFVE